MCRTCLAPRREVSALEAVLSVRTSVCTLKLNSSISAFSPRVLHAPSTAAYNSLSLDDREITACVVVPAKVGCLSSIKCVQPELFRVAGHAAQFTSLSDDLGRHGLSREARQQHPGCPKVGSSKRVLHQELGVFQGRSLLPARPVLQATVTQQVVHVSWVSFVHDHLSSSCVSCSPTEHTVRHTHFKLVVCYRSQVPTELHDEPLVGSVPLKVHFCSNPT